MIYDLEYSSRSKHIEGALYIVYTFGITCRLHFYMHTIHAKNNDDKFNSDLWFMIFCQGCFSHTASELRFVPASESQAHLNSYSERSQSSKTESLTVKFQPLAAKTGFPQTRLYRLLHALRWCWPTSRDILVARRIRKIRRSGLLRSRWYSLLIT